MNENSWIWTYDEWAPEHQPVREAICTLGNGYFATRGAAEESSAGECHYPGTYLAGGFNRLESVVAGRVVENEDLVNWPNWLCLSFRFAGGEWFNIDSSNLLDFQQSLDLRRGVLQRRLRWRDPENRETTLVSRRLVHMADPHLAAIQWILTPENWSGDIEIRSALDGSVVNAGVERYRELSNRHLEVLDAGRVDEDGVYLHVQTNQSQIRMVQAARTRVYDECQFHERRLAALQRQTLLEAGVPQQRLTVSCQREKPLCVEKVVAIYTSRDFAISEPTIAAQTALCRAGGFDQLLESHSRAWSRLWNRADIQISDSNDWSQRVLRLHIFHLLQTVSFNSIDLDVGVPARGLHGEAYRGHIFWDELFIFPFLNQRIPELTRSLLMYRYRRLPEARHLAQTAGYRGAMFPWQSGSCGREESQVLHLNPKSGRWVPDTTHRQRHVNAAIAYNVWQFQLASGDLEFFSFHGAEVLLEIARFWASIATYNAQRDRYEIHNVVGPDEFHTHYPGRKSEGLNNNAYTNAMASWVLWCAGQALEMLAEDRRAELIEELQISDEELERWDNVSRKMFVPMHGEGIISQFEGYDDLEEFDWEAYKNRYGDIQRLDRILEAEGDDPNRYKVSKQADVLMLFYLFATEELRNIFEHMGYTFDPGMIPRNIEYYMKRTSHGSTLSRVVHSWVLARSDRQWSWQLFRDALASDVEDIQGGTTSEGIHLGAMAGTVDLIQRCHSGIDTWDSVLWLNPCLPDDLKEVHLRIRFRGHWLRLHVTHREVAVRFEHGWPGPAKIGFQDQIHLFSQGDEKRFALP